jgi:hypothetical protein
LTLRVNQSLAKTAAGVNYPSARLPRLIQIVAPFSSRLSRDNYDHETVKHHEIDCFDVLSIMYDMPVDLMLFGNIEFYILINLSAKRMHGHERKYEGN